MINLKVFILHVFAFSARLCLATPNNSIDHNPSLINNSEDQIVMLVYIFLKKIENMDA